jgi:GTP-binding protein Era
VFVDTPGVYKRRTELDRFMVRQALKLVDDVDAVLFMVLAGERNPGVIETQIVDRIAEARKPAILVMNKVDLVRDKPRLLAEIDAWSQRAPFAAIVPISASQGKGVDALMPAVLALLPEGAPLFEDDALTDRSERFFVTELIREQLFLLLRQELPYSTTVVIDAWTERPEKGDTVIDASIVIERESQQKIVVGKGGAMIREVGTIARREVSERLGRPAHLRLRVRVAPDWTTSTEALSKLGYGEDA